MKAVNPDFHVIFGGPLCRKNISDMKWFNEETSIDIMVFGEGEDTLSDILDMIEHDNIRPVDGTVMRQYGEIVSGDYRKAITCLDELPEPDFSGFPQEKYTKRKEVLIAGSRGCIGKCSFCQDREIGRFYRFRTADSLFAEVKNRMEQGYECFEFCDLLLNGNLKELERFCNLIIKSNMKIHWGGPIRVNPEMTTSLFKKMRKTGVNTLNIGIESGSQKMLDLMKKGFRVADAEKNMKDMTSADIRRSINILIGFPGEDEETIKETKEFLKRNRHFISHVSSLTPFYLLEGTDAYEHSEKLGMVRGKNINQWKTKDEKNTFNWRLEKCTEIFELICDLGIDHECNQYYKEKASR